MMIGRCGGPPRNSAEFIGSSFLAHTHKIRGRPGPRASNSIPSRPLKGKRSRPSHFITSTPRTHEPPNPRAPEPPSECSFALPNLLAVLQSLQWPWLWCSWSVATRIADGRLCMSPPSSPGDVAVSQWTWGSQRERTQKKKKTSAPRSRSSSVNRSVCWSAGMQLHWIPHSQHTLPALNSVSAV